MCLFVPFFGSACVITRVHHPSSKLHAQDLKTTSLFVCFCMRLSTDVIFNISHTHTHTHKTEPRVLSFFCFVLSVSLCVGFSSPSIASSSIVNSLFSYTPCLRFSLFAHAHIHIHMQCKCQIHLPNLQSHSFCYFVTCLCLFENSRHYYYWNIVFLVTIQGGKGIRLLWQYCSKRKQEKRKVKVQERKNKRWSEKEWTISQAYELLKEGWGGVKRE